MDNGAPCKGCLPPKRNPGCHDECELYVKWKKEHDAEQKRIREENRMKYISIIDR